MKLHTYTCTHTHTHTHTQTVETDGARMSRPKGLAIAASSNISKSTSVLLSATNNSNKNEEVVHRENKLKKVGSSTTNLHDPRRD